MSENRRLNRVDGYEPDMHPSTMPSIPATVSLTQSSMTNNYYPQHGYCQSGFDGEARIESNALIGGLSGVSSQNREMWIGQYQELDCSPSTSTVTGGMQRYTGDFSNAGPNPSTIAPVNTPVRNLTQSSYSNIPFDPHSGNSGWRENHQGFYSSNTAQDSQVHRNLNAGPAERMHDERQRVLDERERELGRLKYEWEQDLQAREAALEQNRYELERAILQHRHTVGEQERLFSRRENAQNEREEDLIRRESELNDKEMKYQLSEKEVIQEWLAPIGAQKLQQILSGVGQHRQRSSKENLMRIDQIGKILTEMGDHDIRNLFDSNNRLIEAGLGPMINTFKTIRLNNLIEWIGSDFRTWSALLQRHRGMQIFFDKWKLHSKHARSKKSFRAKREVMRVEQAKKLLGDDGGRSENGDEEARGTAEKQVRSWLGTSSAPQIQLE